MKKPITKSARRARPKGARSPTPKRSEKSAARREAILLAALDEFSARGFATARLEDVAKRAGVAKGTIYLYFRDKELLFQEIIRSLMGPVVGTVQQSLEEDLPLRVLAERIIEFFTREVFGTRRKDIIRLVMTEGPRFPKLAEFYYREILSRMLGSIRARLRKAYDAGEISHEALIRFPQLVAAPGMMAIIWSGLFDRFEPLDVKEMMRAHLKILFGEGRS